MQIEMAGRGGSRHLKFFWSRFNVNESGIVRVGVKESRPPLSVVTYLYSSQCQMPPSGFSMLQV